MPVPATGLDEFSEFVAARSTVLLRTASLLCAGDRSAGEDLLQEALIEAYLRWNRIREAASREADVRRILVRLAARRWQRRTSLAEIGGPRVQVGMAEGEEPQGAVDKRMDVMGALARLPARQRVVIVLRYYEDMSEAAIAETLGCSVGTVKVHASRALRSLANMSAPNTGSGEEREEIADGQESRGVRSQSGAEAPDRRHDGG